MIENDYDLKVLACIPAFNEGKIIRKTIQEVSKYVDQVVVCDDGSTDNTQDEVRNTIATLLVHKENKGKGISLKTLFEYARGTDADIIVTIDGDGQFMPQEIPKLVKPILENKSDIVIGYRFDVETDMPAYRRVGNKFFDKLTNLASDLPFRDTQSGLRSYSKKAINLINFNSSGFGVDSEILIDASKKGLRITEEKITVIYDTGGKTSTKNPISHSGDIFGTLIEIIALKHPLKFLGIPGIILLIISIAYSGVVISIFNSTRYFSIPSTLVVLGCLIMGLMLLLMSVVLFAIQRALKK